MAALNRNIRIAYLVGDHENRSVEMMHMAEYLTSRGVLVLFPFKPVGIDPDDKITYAFAMSEWSRTQAAAMDLCNFLVVMNVDGMITSEMQVVIDNADEKPILYIEDEGNGTE